MAKNLKLLVILFAGTGLFSSCEKMGHKDENKRVKLNITVNAGTAYQLDLSPYGDEDDIAAITTQAVKYQTSEITKNAAGKYTYTFLRAGSPKAGGNGTDLVALKVSEPQGRCNNHATEITINLTIL
jgi:hypothetical protein